VIYHPHADGRIILQRISKTQNLNVFSVIWVINLGRMIWEVPVARMGDSRILCTGW